MKLCASSIVFCLLALAGCNAPVKPDYPRLLPGARTFDLTLHSAILDRDTRIRIFTPVKPLPAAPIVYLLHGAGEDYRDWSNQSSIADLAAKGFVLVMPDSEGGYYINDASGSHHAYETYFLSELIPAIHHAVPFASFDRSATAIVGISRGGYGALVLGLKHPELFSYIGGLSPAVDLAERPFRLSSPVNSIWYSRVFGPVHGLTRTSNDPFLLVARKDSEVKPFLYLTCGNQDVLLASNRRFAELLEKNHIPFTFQALPGSHNWGVWSAEIPTLESSIIEHIKPSAVPVTP